MTSNYQGERKAIAIGRGLVFKDHNPYTQGDDFRAIDWKVYGRTDRYYIKRYEEERNLTVHIIIDYSGSMNYGNKTKKYEYAAQLGIGFAYLAMKNNERFVVSTFADKLELFKPKRGASQMASMFEHLNTKKAEGNSNFQDSLKHYKRLIDSKSLIIIVSDFLYDAEEIKRALYRFKGNEILCVQVLDETEMDLKFNGSYNLEDLETERKMKTYISPLVRKTYQEELSKHNSLVDESCASVGAVFKTVSTGDNIFDSFYKLLVERVTKI